MKIRIGEKSQEEVLENNDENADTEEEIGESEVNEDENLTQMELDAKYIKENYSMRLPLRGAITSRFGNRNPTLPTIPKFHTGIDIAVNTGTVIVAAMAGKVELVSDVGNYRKTFKNSRW